jgi:RecG-like helicase
MMRYLKKHGIEEFADPETGELVNPKEMDIPEPLLELDGAGYVDLTIGLRKGRYALIGTDYDGKKKTIVDFSSYGEVKDYLKMHGVAEDKVKTSPSMRKREKERVAWVTSDRKEYFTDDDGEGAQKKALKSAEESFAFLSSQVYPGYSAALVHSRVDEDEQNRILTDFREGKIQILVATTVVEVGVDVPKATCMVIEQADHFGLAALHQLRGRVGRGSLQSFCFLVYSAKISETGIARMKIMRESTDGFEIAEEDLRLRGPGEITGTAQSGELTFAIADPVRDKDLMLQARKDAFTQVLGQQP